MRKFTIAFPHRAGAGGPGSFQKRFEIEAIKRGWRVVYSDTRERPDLVLVVGGTKKLLWLAVKKIQGSRIIHRLDGINWLHRVKPTTVSRYLLNTYRNFSNKIIHGLLANHVIYQSRFARDWWNKEGLLRRKNYSIIYNGVDTTVFRPDVYTSGPISLICLEGNLDYSPYAVDLLNALRKLLPDDLVMKLYGNFEYPDNITRLDAGVKYCGSIENSKVPTVFRQAIYLSLDVNPACPNTVVEALACGAPVVGFRTGALEELVQDQSGITVPYGSDPWKLKMPDVPSLAEAVMKIYCNFSFYSANARKIAQERYKIENMFDSYSRAIEELVGPDL